MAELHQESFRRFGGSVRVIVLDNLRQGVLKLLLTYAIVPGVGLP